MHILFFILILQNKESRFIRKLHRHKYDDEKEV